MNTSSPEANWLVCHTKPRCEKKFAALMNAENFEHYLPLIESVRRYSKEIKRFTKPLFPGYVFAKIPLVLKSRIYQQDLLARAIPVDDEALLLRQLEDVRAIVSSGFTLSLFPMIKRGARAKVIGGPLRGLEGVIDDPANPNGIVICVDVLQQGLLVKVPLTDLEALP
ncbi:MAG: transcription termination/antitermination NusG family protein [Nibricoccus sp.]